MVKRFMMIVMSAVITAGAAAPALLRTEAAGDVVQMEYLDRGTVAIRTDGGIYLSWRLLGTEAYDTAFDIYRDGEKIATVSDSTNYTDTSAGLEYTVVVSGEPISSGDTVTVNDEQYLKIPLDVPEGGISLDGEEYTYSPNDVTPADVDGDGEYELILKWEPSNSFDSGKNAKHTGNVYIDCYEMSGEKLWRIDMGININAGAHFTQMAAYDFDLDGKAELMLKTAPGTMDGTGRYVSEVSLFDEIRTTDNSADYRHSEYSENDTSGRVMSGPEFYTVFQGDTGAALDTIYYPHPRNDGYWGDDWGNRSERYLAGVAYLDGQIPSAITWRGYYAKTTVTAYNLENKRLVEVADFDTDDGDNYVYSGNGNHNLTVGDVDGDGCDELISGSIALDNDLTVLWCSGRGHGDALHLADYDPTHKGLEYMSVHEDDSGSAITGSTTGNDGKSHLGGMTLYKAENGEELFHVDSGNDTGRGMMANVGYGDGYFDFWGAGNYISYGGDIILNGRYYASSTNQRIFWNGDIYDELLDGTGSGNFGSQIGISDNSGRIATFSDVLTNNGSKNNPCLIADLFGDWREEFVARSADNSSLKIYTTVIPTEHKLYTLMHDRMYRMQVACQNAGYNQPPHIGYYIDEENSAADMRKYAAYVKTVNNGMEELRTENTPDMAPDVTVTTKPTPKQTPEPTPTIDPSIEFVVNNGVLTEYRGNGGAVVIPSSYNGQKITEIGFGAFAGNTELTSVTVGDGIKIIASSAFDGCTDLEEVTLGLGTEMVYSNAFDGCTSLVRLIVSDRNTQLYSLFDDYSLNKTLNIYGYTGSEAEKYAHSNNAVFIAIDSTPEPTPAPSETVMPDVEDTPTPEPENTYVPEFEADENGVLTAYNGTDTEVMVPEIVDGMEILAIGAGTFEDRADITAITLPDTVARVERTAFSGCSALERINTNRLEYVGEYAFYGCDALKELYFEGNVIFGRGALDGCSSLGRLTVLGMHTYIDGIPEGTEIYGYRGSATEYSALMEDMVFYDAESGERVIKDFIVHPDEGSLDMYKGTNTNIVIPSEVDGVTVTAVGSAFMGSGIISVVIPDSVESIYYGAFEDCTELESVTVGCGVTSLRDAFFGCEKLAYVRIPSNVTEIEDGIFDTCPNVVIYCGEGSVAHEYAQINDIPFVIVEENVPTPEPSQTVEPTSVPTAEVNKYPYDIVSMSTGGNIRPGYIQIAVKCNEYKENTSLILAEYDETGRLCGIQIEPLTRGEGMTELKQMEYSGAEAKAFVWNIERMQPYSEMSEKRYNSCGGLCHRIFRSRYLSLYTNYVIRCNIDFYWF